MASFFKTIGSTLQAVDTIAASGSRRLSVWATEQEKQTKYRHVTRMMTIARESAMELSAELKLTDEALKDPDTKRALEMLTALDKAEAAADAK